MNKIRILGLVIFIMFSSTAMDNKKQPQYGIEGVDILTIVEGLIVFSNYDKTLQSQGEIVQKLWSTPSGENDLIHVAIPVSKPPNKLESSAKPAPKIPEPQLAPIVYMKNEHPELGFVFINEK